jgi:hypothetical protein
METIRILLALALLTFASCKSGNRDTKQNTHESPASYSFVIPEIPIMISSRENQAAFLTDHYWDNFDFSDTTDLEIKKVIEEGFAEYLMILGEVAHEKAAGGIRSLMQNSSGNEKLSLYFAEKAEKYLYHPNSPIRNELLYEEFLRGILASQNVEPIRKARFQNQYDMAQLNKPGKKATDFEYSLKNGNLSTLYKTSGKYIMLYFHNPDCHECAAMKDRIVNSEVIRNLTDKKELTILSVYPDKDLDLWNKHYADFPENWINAFDKETIILDQELYDLKAIPTIYLLDSGKTVLLRDPTFEQFEDYLENL